MPLFPLEFPASFGTPKPSGPPIVVGPGGIGLNADRNQIISLHTYKGVQLYQYTPDLQYSLGWGREKNNVSKCAVSVPSELAEGVLPSIVPWLHWISVWDDQGRRLHWTGPVQDWQANRDQITINSADCSAYFKRAVCPMTKRWEATDPGFIARELLEAVLEQQGIPTAPLVRPDPRVDKFDFAATFEEQMFDQTIASLVDLGLTWSVAMGRPILGPLSFKPITALSENDFMEGSPVIARDGKDMANEIILRAPGTIARARVPVEGLNLQRIVDLDSMFSVSNAQRAANQYVRYTAKTRDTLMLPGGIRLHPDAPVGLDELIPGARFTIEAYGLLSLMELTAMEVQCRDGDIMVNVTMVGVDDDPPELLELQGGPQGGFGGGGV